MEKELIEIARILKAQGIKGELKIKPIGESAEKLKKDSKVKIGHKEYFVEYVRRQPNGLILKLSGVNDRNSAEAFGQEAVIIEKNAVELDEGEYFISDIIGSELYSGGESIGVVNDVLQYGAADVYRCCGNGGEFMFPALKKVLINIDVKNKRIDLDGSVLKEIIVDGEK